LATVQGVRNGKFLCATRMLLLALKWILKFVTP
jgi:hypothetical protein